MAYYSFTQPTAPSWTTSTNGSASVSDTYALFINSNTTAPKGLWVINDAGGLTDTFEFNITLNSRGEFRGPSPVLAQLTTDGRGIWTFADLRTNPLGVVFNGFDANSDQLRVNVYNSNNVLVGQSSFSNFYRDNSSSYDSDIGANVYNFTVHEETWTGEWNDGERGLVVDVSRVVGNQLATRLSQYELNNFDWIDVQFDDDAFQGAATGLDLTSVGNIDYQFWLSANATNNQIITETNTGNWDTVEYSIEGVDSSGNSSFVSDASNLQSLTLNWNSAAKTVVRTLNNNGGSFTDSFTGIENFRLTNADEIVNIDTRGLNNWANVSALGGNNTFNIETSTGQSNNWGAVLLAFGTPWSDFEKNGVFGNFTGELQTRLYKPTVGNDYSISLNSFNNQDGSSTAMVYNSFAGYDTVNFRSSADVNEFHVEGSKFSDRFFVGDLGMSGAINQFAYRGNAGYDVLRVTDENTTDTNVTNLDRISIVADYRYAHHDISDGTGQEADYLPLKVFSGVIQKGDLGIYGIDRIQREKDVVIHSEEYILNHEANYLEWNVNSNAEQMVFQLGRGADRAYIKPLLSDINDVMMVDFSEWMGSDGARDILEIDFHGILEQYKEQTSSTTTKIVLTGVESQDQIRFVNPYDQMVRTAYNDGNSATTNDAQLGWTFTKSHTSGANTYTHNVHVLFQDDYTGAMLSNSQVNATSATPLTVSSRTVYDYATYAMTTGVDNAILFEDSGYHSFYNFLAGDDFVILRDGNLDVVLGAGDDFASVSGNVGEAIVIGGTGNDNIGLNGLIGSGGAQSDWVFTTMDVATARTTFASKYALNPAANPFEIELSLSNLEVVTVGQRYEDGTTWNSGTRKYTGVGDVLQTVYFQAETVSTVNNGDISVDTLYGSRDYSTGVTTAGNFNYYGRRGTEDSLTITLADGNALARAMSNINSWFVTSTNAEYTLYNSVLSGSHVTTIYPWYMDGGLSGVWATYNLVDIEKITLRGGSEEVTIRLAGSNGYASVAEAVSAADYKDVIFVAKTIETASTNIYLMGSTANQTTVDIPAGLGVVFEPVYTSNTFKVNITDQMVADAPMNADRLVYLLGQQNIDVSGSALSDMIIGNQGNNIMHGGGGNDVMYGGGGNDTLFGQSGNDLLIGSAGNDFLNAGTGDDTLVAYGTKRSWTTVFDSTNMIGGSGHDDFVFLNGKGSMVAYGGSGEDGYTIMPGWENGLSRTGTAFDQQIVNGVATVLDYSTTSDFTVGKALGSLSPESYFSNVNLTLNQLVSPPRPLGSSYDAKTFTTGTTMQANADGYMININTQTTLGSLLEDYGLMNDVTEYRLHQAA